MLPHVIEFLLPRTYKEKAQIPEILGKTELNRSINDKVGIAPSLIKGLIEDLEIPDQLRDFNVSKESIPNIVKDILMDIQGEKNVIVMDTQDLSKEITALLEAAW
ncbi:iron-containing alcohol dehydrogenase [Alkalihalobacterium elongatum]|uniref:iron-containing alcohol dehydrogenase n=1 Tax=Alkalihalobacterium elongatum TaxID=2675466 RepID=UPI001C200831|nr:iron-containing alcohol dehydrogenase [Alkalihalobacterium elongatum]